MRIHWEYLKNERVDPERIRQIVDRIGRAGETPLVVSRTRGPGVIRLKTMPPGIAARLADLRAWLSGRSI